MKALRKIGLLALIISFLTINLCYGQNSAEQTWTKGVEYAAQGKFKEAKGEFEKALEVDPYYDPAKRALKVIEDVIDQKIKSKTAIHLFKGQSYREKAQWDEAIAEYNIALEINPKFAMAYNNRGIAYRWKGQYDQAISDHNKAIEINPRYIGAYISRGITYGAKGQLDRAISDFSKAIEINPRDAVAYTYRGYAYGEKGQYNKAISDYNKAIEINPRDAWVCGNRGNAYYKKGQFDQAISDYTKALEIDPKYTSVYVMRGNAYDKKAQYDQAISDFSKAIELNPRDAYVYVSRGHPYDKKGQYDQAISDYTKAIEIDPKYAWAYGSRGHAFLNKYQYDQAISDFDKAIEINRREAWAYYHRGITCFLKREYEKGWDDVRKAQDLGYQVHPGFLTSLPTALPELPAFTFGEISRTEKLLRAGSEPRRKLRYKFRVGKEHKLVMDMLMTIGTKVDDYRKPAEKTPVVRMNARVNCKSLTPEGNLRLELMFESVEVIGEPGIPPEVAALMQLGMKDIEGVSGWSIISPRAVTIDGGFSVPPDAKPVLKQTLNQVFQQLQKQSLIFPEDSVGVGAQWEITIHTPKPFETTLVAVYELVELVGDKGKMKVLLEQKAEPQKVKYPGPALGLSLFLESMRATGSGTIAFDLTKPVPQSDAEMRSSMRWLIEAEGEKKDMSMDMDIRFKLQSK